MTVKIKPIEWGEVSEPDNNIPYNYVKGETPIGEFLITWKGWKESPSYDVEFIPDRFEGGTYIFSTRSLDDAKSEAYERYCGTIRECLVCN